MTRRHGRTATVALALAALAAVGVPACSTLVGHAAMVRTVDVTIHYSRFSPAHLSVASGTTVRFRITNSDPIDHEFILGDQAVQDREEAGTEPIHDGSVPRMVSVPTGATASTLVTFPKQPANTLIYACHLPGHYAYGMRGLLQVTA